MDLNIPKPNPDNDNENPSELTLLKPQDIMDNNYKEFNHEKGKAIWMDHSTSKPRPQQQESITQTTQMLQETKHETDFPPSSVTIAPPTAVRNRIVNKHTQKIEKHAKKN